MIENNPFHEENTEEVKEIPPIEVNFEQLKNINPDVIGWIYICATETSYPILKGENNDAYLRTTIEGNTNTAGSIFMEEQNSANFMDPNTIIYGHSMKNGTMFGKLKQFLQNDALEKSPYFWILTPGGNYKYKIFSCYEVNARSDTYTLFYGRDKRFLEWCIKMKDQSFIECGNQTFSIDSNVVTLSTCAAATGSMRRVVQGVLEQ